MPCDPSAHIASGCCSSLWLPQVDLPNLLDFNYQVNPPRWHIWVDPNSTVHWTVRLDGTWFSPYDFRAWPLEHQHLLVEMQLLPAIADKASLVLGSTSPLKNTPHTKGVDLAGWWVSQVTPRLYDTTACYNAANFTQYAYDLNPATGVAEQRAFGPTQWALTKNDQTVVTVIDSSQCDGVTDDEATVQYGPYVLVIDTMMQRDKVFYVTIFIVPLLIVTLLVFVVYAMERSNIEARMGVVVTLVLALSALQFVYDFPPASYLNVVQQLTLTSYSLFALVAIESIITSSITRIHQRRERHNALLMAAGLRSVHLTSSLHGQAHAQSRAPSGLPFDASSDTDGSFTPASGLMFGASSGKAWPPVERAQSSPAAAPASASASSPATSAGPGGFCVAPLRPAPPPADAAAVDELPLRMTPIVEAHDESSEDSASKSLGHNTSLDRTRKNRYQLSSSAQQLGSSELPFPRASGPGPVAEGMAWGMMKGKSWRSSSSLADSSDPQMQPITDVEMAGRDSAAGLGGKSGAAPTMRRTYTQRAYDQGRKLLGDMHTATKNMRTKISKDEAFAQLLARKVDLWTSCFLFVSYIVVVIVLICVSSSIGDHKLMLAGSVLPGNM